jgi:hypothetical protein
VIKQPEESVERLFVVMVEIERLASPASSFLITMPSISSVSERPRGQRGHTSQPTSLTVQPVVEGRALRYVKSLQKVALVELKRGGGIS